MGGRSSVGRLAAGTAAVAALVAWAVWPSPIPVDVAAVTRGPLLVTIDEDGETRVRHRFVVSTPLEGEVGRVALEPGDRVVRGRTVVTTIRPDPSPLLDARSQADAEAAVDAARATLQQARAGERRALTARELARKEQARHRELAEGGLATPQRVDASEAEAAEAEEAAHGAAFAVATAAAELERAERRLRPPAGVRPADMPIVAPVDGVVLRRLRESGATVPEGTPLLEIGDPADIEVVADLLSTDAVAVRPGARVLIEQWGGDGQLTGRVRRVSPAGATKVSALGVEEQRVDVVIDLDGPAAARAALGDAYGVEVRVVVADLPDVVRVPTGALFRQGEGWAVFRVEAGRAQTVPVRLGRRTPAHAEVLEGLSSGDAVIVHPPDTLDAGETVRPRVPAGGRE